jgi:hypothetical protein
MGEDVIGDSIFLSTSNGFASVLVSVVPQYSGVSAGPVGASVDFLVVVLVLIRRHVLFLHQSVRVF